MSSQCSDIFGVRESSNASFAPSTRVLKPPGGGSSIIFSEASSEAPVRTGGKARVAPPQSCASESCFSGASSEAPRRSGKARVQSCASESSLSIGWDNERPSAQQQHRIKTSTASWSNGENTPVAGARSSRLHELKTQNADRLGKIKQKTESDDWSSAVSDQRVTDVTRFHRDSSRGQIGRQQKPSVLRPEASKSVCESHRYYLAADGQADRITGKGAPQRSSSEASLVRTSEPSAAGRPRSRASMCSAESSAKSYSIAFGSRVNDDRCSRSKYSQSESSQAISKQSRSSASQATTATRMSRTSQSCYSDRCSEVSCDSIPFGADWATLAYGVASN